MNSLNCFNEGVNTQSHRSTGTGTGASAALCSNPERME